MSFIILQVVLGCGKAGGNWKMRKSLEIKNTAVSPADRVVVLYVQKHSHRVELLVVDFTFQRFP